MHSKFSTCIKVVGENPKCPSCNGCSIKYGHYSIKRSRVRHAVSRRGLVAFSGDKDSGYEIVSNNKNQRYYCKSCQKSFIKSYNNQAYHPHINHQITSLVKESCGIRSISRLLRISTTTLLKRILNIAKNTPKPVILKGGHYEVDEMRTFVKKKSRRIWIVYALERSTKSVVSFNVGARTNKTLNAVLKTLHYAKAKTIYTDKLPAYRYLIEDKIHSTQYRGTNHIERKNLSIRTQLKRLSRRTICFSKSAALLIACLAIYFWT
ncbi:MAG: IS1 family transposase [Bacteroidota bacterium]